MDDALPLFRLFRPAPPAERTAPPPRPRVRGPVLMGDLHAAPGGRPLLLWHWDRGPDDPEGT